MNIRVTAQTQSNNAIANLQQQTSSLAGLQNQLSSGFRIQVPSDDPAGYAALARAKADSVQLSTYGQTIADATSTLDSGVGALQDVTAVLTRAKQIATEGADGSTDGAGLSALATEVDGLITRAVAAGNTAVDGTYLFGGTATGAAPFQVTTDAQGNPATVGYSGAPVAARTLVGAGQTVDTRYAGSRVFQQPGADVFQTLIGLRDDLRNPAATAAGVSQALNARLGQIDAAAGAVLGATAQQSSSLATLSSQQSRNSDLKLAADGQVGTVGGTDYTSAIVQYQQVNNTLQASLAVSAKLLQPNLLDFIR